jgi:hypothetical protein
MKSTRSPLDFGISSLPSIPKGWSSSAFSLCALELIERFPVNTEGFISNLETPVVLNWGLGVDSTCWLLRVLIDPALQTFDLQNFVVLIVQVGWEWGDTHFLAQNVVLPLLRKMGIRTVQVCRRGASLKDGFEILSDTREPVELFVRTGRFGLADEMIRGGTLPTIAKGTRTCSPKWKGACLDWFCEQEFGNASRTVIVGFNADEQDRIKKDHSFSSDTR